MAKGYISVYNGSDEKKLPIGFSWTVLFFNFFPALFRDDWKGGIVLLFLAFLTFGWSALVAAFFYNRYYARMIISEKYKVVSFHGITETEAKRMLGLTAFEYYNDAELSRKMDMMDEAVKQRIKEGIMY